MAAKAPSKGIVVRAQDGFNLPPLNREDGTAYGWFDQWSMNVSIDGKYVTDYSDWEARDLFEMLSKDYKARQMENVLTLPITSAERTIVAVDGDNGEAKWLTEYWDTDAISGGCRTPLNHIIGLMTSAFAYKRAYFEKVFRKGTGKFTGKYVYDDVAFRPQTTCRIMREPRSGRFAGFEQTAYFTGMAVKSNDKWPIQIKKNRAFVYTHGTMRDPLNGASDFEVAFWAWRTKQKILMLWFQFLQSVALPRVVVKSPDLSIAQSVANEIAKMKSSGVLPVSTPGGADSVTIDLLDQSGKGSEQFNQAITWLDNAATQSILAGFLNLTNRGTPMDGVGSFALSKDASDFFLQSLETKAREMEEQIREQVFAPLIFANFGADAAVPKLQFEPLNDIDKATAVSLLQAAMAAPPGGPIPTTFIAALAEQVSNYLGLDGAALKEDFQQSFDQAQEVARQQQAETHAQQIAGMGAAVDKASAMVAGKAKAPSKQAQEVKSAVKQAATTNIKTPSIKTPAVKTPTVTKPPGS